MQLQPLGINHFYASHSGNKHNYMLLNFVHVFLFQLQICPTVMFSFLFKMLLMLPNNTSLCVRLELTASEHHTEVQTGDLTEESWKVVEVFMHKQVIRETGNYFRISCQMKSFYSALLPPGCLFVLKSSNTSKYTNKHLLIQV